MRKRGSFRIPTLLLQLGCGSLAALACGCDERSESATGAGRVGLEADEF